MSNLGARHPGGEQLLRFADGEFPAAQAKKIRQHLSTCWQCRTDLEEIEQTVSECVRYRKVVFDNCLPPPPEPWFDIYPRMAEIDESRKRRQWAGRVLDWLAAGLHHPRRWAPAAIMLLLLAVVVQQFRQTPSVKAAELLHKAVAAAESRPAKPRRIQIRTKTQRLTRIVGGGGTLAKENGAASLVGLESMFRAAHYNWEDPLSAKSYAAWRDQLPDKRDEVTMQQDRYQLRTSTDSGELAAATLQLHAGDLRAVEGTLEFRNREWIEISELPDAPPLVPSAPSETATAAPAPRLAPPERTAEAPAPAATPGEELAVMSALHRLGADLGDPVEVTRSGGQILVTGTGVAPERQQEIRRELSAMPQVTVEFSKPEGPAPAAHGTGGISVRPGTGRWQTELEKQLGGRAAFEQFADHILETSDALMSRAHALRRLAARFPADVEAQMTPEQQQVLHSLCREHADALLKYAIEIESRIEPPLATLGASAPALHSTTTAGTWQEATGQLFGEARRAETLLVDMLGVSAGETQAEDLPAQLTASLTQLRNRAENYERLTTAR